jgi:hypothetical protein
VALQGTLDTFALPDVLRLLSTTRKTGRLDVTGDRGRGAAWLDGGLVVAAEAGSASRDLPEATFELLRFGSGTFSFDTTGAAERPGPGMAVDDLIAQAEEMLEEWRAIESVVPSLDLRISLRRDLEAEEVTLDRQTWATIAAVGSGTTVRRLAQDLGLGEFLISRTVRALVDQGIVDLGEVSASFSIADFFDQPAPVAAVAPSVDEPIAPQSFVAPQPFDVDAPFDQERPVDSPSTDAPGAVASVLDLSPPPPPPPPPPPLVEAAAPDAEPEVDLFATRALQPPSADATEPERDDADEAPLDRASLLKFLSSIKH